VLYTPPDIGVLNKPALVLFDKVVGNFSVVTDKELHLALDQPSDCYRAVSS
jgi:hypothetical protein